mmetsp:Transcript_11973/g.21477  ORF Transcript_11973/g.21477 Transcript_11973/m.21477 type:complete len:362 (-) Transcript_11973:129-1214(-)
MLLSRATTTCATAKKRIYPYFVTKKCLPSTSTHICRAKNKISLFSPSKINLFLRVTKRRTDGYHDLASLFHVIDLGDDMEFELLPYSTHDILECSDPTIPTDGRNLVIKALDLFRRKTSLLMYFRVRLTKRVPHGAGLGGGSGNAATTLWAANKLTGEPATDEELLEWSGEIGSDISFFFSEGAAFCTGRGEIVQSIPSPFVKSGSECALDRNGAPPLLLVKPPIGLATPRIFKALDLEKRSKVDPQDLLDGFAAFGREYNVSSKKKKEEQSQTNLQGLLVNDLEQPAFDILPELKDLKNRLINSESGFDGVVMTGSGSTIVCVGGDAKAPTFLSKDEKYKDVFISKANLITRKSGKWYGC